MVSVFSLADLSVCGYWGGTLWSEDSSGAEFHGSSGGAAGEEGLVL